MSARRLAIFAVAFTVLAAVAYSLYWFHGAGQARNHVQSWADARRAQGWKVQWQDLEVSGFPLRLTITVTQPELTTPSGLSWHTGQIRVWSNPLWPDSAHLSTQGRQDIRWRDRDLTVEVEALTATMAPGTMDAHVHTLRHASGFEAADLALSTAALPPRPTATGHPASWRFALSSRDIALPGPELQGFAPHVALAEISGRVMGDVPEAPPMAAIAGWSKQGGVLELDHLAVDWPPLGLEGDGTAALDPHGQPLVALSTRIHGFDAAMDQLASNGLVEPATGRTLKTILGLMSKPDHRGRPAIPAPLSIQDGQLYLGPTRLAPVPAIPWADFAAP